MTDTPDLQSTLQAHDAPDEPSPADEPTAPPDDIAPPLAGLIASIRAAVIPRASAEAGAVGTNACRSILTVLKPSPVNHSPQRRNGHHRHTTSRHQRVVYRGSRSVPDRGRSVGGHSLPVQRGHLDASAVQPAAPRGLPRAATGRLTTRGSPPNATARSHARSSGREGGLRGRPDRG